VTEGRRTARRAGGTIRHCSGPDTQRSALGGIGVLSTTSDVTPSRDPRQLDPRATLTAVKPQVPDTPVFRALRSLSTDDLEREMAVAQRLVTAAQTYLEWVRLTVQATQALADLSGEKDSITIRVDSLASARAEGGANVISIRNGSRPTLKNALLMIMSEDRRRWRKPELLAELKKREWLPAGKTPDKQMTNRLSEMVVQELIIRHSPGVFSIAATDDSTQATRPGDGETA